MSRPEAVLVVLWLGVTLYAVFGGADFGAGSGISSPGAPSGGRGRGP